EASEGTIFIASSRPLGWDGVVAEVGRSVDWAPDDIAVAGHLVAINLDSELLRAERKGPHGFGHAMMPPGSLWIQGAGTSFSLRNHGTAHWGAVEVSVDRARRVLGRDIEPRQSYGIFDATLAAVVRALLLEAETRGTSGRLFADGLVVAIASRLARHAGL